MRPRRDLRSVGLLAPWAGTNIACGRPRRPIATGGWPSATFLTSSGSRRRASAMGIVIMYAFIVRQRMPVKLDNARRPTRRLPCQPLAWAPNLAYRSESVDRGNSIGDQSDLLARTQRAREHFEKIGRGDRIRWLECELNGYQASTEARRLHDVLSLPRNDALLGRVVSYRTQTGTRADTLDAWRHFFVESLGDLLRAAQRVHHANVTTPTIDLSFEPNEATTDYPRTVAFPADVFERVLRGFASALQDEVGTAP